jgi:sorting nexin-3/12
MNNPIGAKYIQNKMFDFKIVVPTLPTKAWQRQLPFRNDAGIFEDDFIEERRKGLETFINK